MEEVLETMGHDPDEVDLVFSDDLGESETGPDTLVLHTGRADVSLNREVASTGATLWDEPEIVEQVGRAALVELGAEFELELSGDMDVVMASPIKVDREGALELAAPYISEDAVGLLEMVPHALFEYSCSCTVGDEDVEESFEDEGTAALDMVGGELSGLRFGEVQPIPVSEAGELVEPEMEPGETASKVRNLLAEDMSRTVRLEKEKRQTQVYETRKIEPPLDEIVLSDGEVVYRGIWTVKGGRTEVVIDSYTGEVLSPDTKGGVELV